MLQGYRPAESVGSDGKVTKYGNYTWFSYEDCVAMRDAVGAAIEHENMAPAGPDGVSVASCHPTVAPRCVIPVSRCVADPVRRSVLQEPLRVGHR
jgi:hypothetical protein